MSFMALKVKIFLKNGILGGAFYKNFEWVMYTESPLKLKGRKKSLEGRMRPAGRTLAMPALVVNANGK